MTHDEIKAKAAELRIHPTTLKARIAKHGVEKAIAMGGPMDPSRAAKMQKRSPWRKSVL